VEAEQLFSEYSHSFVGIGKPVKIHLGFEVYVIGGVDGLRNPENVVCDGTTSSLRRAILNVIHPGRLNVRNRVVS
jgi:hypothetical protein